MAQSSVAIAVHGGAGGTARDSDGCASAAHAGAEVLLEGGDALRAAIRAVVLLEDDGRYNAGRGSALGLDGGAEMDAAVMDSNGALGAVTCLRSIRNPVLAALAVSRSPHWLLAGEGAERFAQAQGLAPREQPSQQARERHGRLMAALGSGAAGPVASALKHQWNYSISWEEALRTFGSGTVGAVAVDARGCFAVATSTGGSAPSLLGRVGDTPIIGCGFFVGLKGAIAVTGVGEYIVPRLLARSIYDAASDTSMQQAIQAAIAGFPSEVDLGIIAISPSGIVMQSNRDMPCAAVRQ
ncbi:MAG: isoaspartyl peptidase/L-asparaginase [Pigmentiphaga sp.]|nr:isoaspartyl peptidase/L-asparaginase [Pigmentiphaga sp.]